MTPPPRILSAKTICNDHRFDAEPLVSAASVLDRNGRILCDGDDDGDADGIADASTSPSSVTFVAWDSFKSNFPSVGHWHLEASNATRARGEFQFQPHWQPAVVNAHINSSVLGAMRSEDAEWRLVVENRWSYSRSVRLSCSKA